MYGASPVPVATMTRFWSGGTSRSVNIPVNFGPSQSRSPGRRARSLGVSSPEETSATNSSTYSRCFEDDAIEYARRMKRPGSAPGSSGSEPGRRGAEAGSPTTAN